MLLEVAAGYGCFRALTDFIGWRRRVGRAQIERYNAALGGGYKQLPPQGQQGARSGRWTHQEPPFEEYARPHDVTDFEIAIRGQTRSFK